MIKHKFIYIKKIWLFFSVILFMTIVLFSCSSKGKVLDIETKVITEEASIVDSNLATEIQSFKINQSRSQQPNSYERTVFYKYPENDNNNSPVVIALHGSGGNAKEEINKYSYLDSHLIVAPQGYNGSWNIARESSKAPDVDFINKIIIELKTFEKIDSDQISIIGYSNGSALINQLLIELESESFKTAVCKFSQLNTLQYREESFWSRSNIDSDDHDLQVLPTSKNRRILSFAGTEDSTCPYYGGIGIFDYNFINAEEAAFIWAKTLGYKGDQIENPILETENYYRFSYMDGKVIHYKLLGAGHGFGNLIEESKLIIKKFVNN